MLKRIFSYMKQYKKYAFLALFCIAVEAVLELMVPMIMADLIDTGVATGDERYIYQKGFQMVLCAAAALVLGIGSARFAALAGQGLGANLREAEYEKLQSYSFANIDHFRVSSIVTRLTSDVTNIQNAVSTGMRPFGRSPVMLIFATGVAFSINSTLALVFFVALPVLAVLLICIIVNVRPLYSQIHQSPDCKQAARAGRHRIIQIGKTDNGWYHHTGKGQSIGGLLSEIFTEFTKTRIVFCFVIEDLFDLLSLCHLHTYKNCPCGILMRIHTAN